MAAWRHEQPGPKLFAAIHGNDTLAQAMARFVIYPGAQSFSVLFFPIFGCLLF